MPKKRAPRKMVINGKTYQPQQFIPNSTPDPLPIDHSTLRIHTEDQDPRKRKAQLEREIASAKEDYQHCLNKITKSIGGITEYDRIYSRFARLHDRCRAHGISLSFRKDAYRSEEPPSPHRAKPLACLFLEMQHGPKEEDIERLLEDYKMRRQGVTPQEEAYERKSIWSAQASALNELREAVVDLDDAHRKITSKMKPSDMRKLKETTKIVQPNTKSEQLLVSRVLVYGKAK